MKRRIVLLAGAGALVPILAPQGMALATQQPATLHFSPPSTGLILTRTLWRVMHDGEQIMVRRRYDVRFVADGSGYRLDGTLIDATVEAPASLALLADLERKRPDSGMFPVRIDASGTILSDSTAPDTAHHGAAAAVAQSLVSKAPIAGADKREAGQQIAQITAGQGAIGNLPPDLFRPQPGERRERRTIALPGGMAGEVEVAIKVSGVQSDGLPQVVERVVTTMLAGTTRVSREVWTLDPK